MSDEWEPDAGERVIFDDHGEWVTGTVVALDGPQQWAIQGDRGGIHTGPTVFAGQRWVWPITQIIDRLVRREGLQP